jgi:hypothetical protein
VVIGRQSSCEIRIDESRISRLHAELTWDPRAYSYSVRDLGSSNGTWVNGRKVESGSPVTLGQGDKIRIGSADVELTYHDDGGATVAASGASRRQAGRETPPIGSTRSRSGGRSRLPRFIGTFLFLVLVTFAVVVIADGAGLFDDDPPPPVLTAPDSVHATSGIGLATVAWEVPTDEPIILFTVIASPGGASQLAGGADREASVGGLDAGTEYTFTVTATYDFGDSELSAPSNPVTVDSGEEVIPPELPSAPVGVSASAGNGYAVVSWFEPESDGGLDITSYTVTSNDGGFTTTVGGIRRSATLMGLTNGTTYTFTVVATTEAGSGETATTDRVVPISAPDAPTAVIAVVVGEGVAVTWSRPASDGGASLESYTVVASPGDVTLAVSANETGAALSGLADGTQYTFTVYATSSYGRSAASAPSNRIRTSGDTATPEPPEETGVLPVPTNVAAIAGNGEATITWEAPEPADGVEILFYTVTASPGDGSATVGVSNTTATVTGLDNGTEYTFTVSVLNGEQSEPSNPVTPTADTTVPGQPTSVTAVAGDGQATVSWTAPDDGGSSIIGYTVTASPDGATSIVSDSLRSASVTGLTNGTEYTFTVTATNDVGEGEASAPSDPVTPNIAVTVPAQPLISFVVAGDAQVSVTWSTPASDGGSVILSYTVVTSPGGATVTVDASQLTATVTGLTNGTPYTFIVAATNGIGESADSTPSVAATPGTVPTEPTNVVAVAGDGQATVSWTAPADDGGSAIESYSIVASPSGTITVVDVSQLSVTVTGLTNGTEYTFIVTATNGIGEGTSAAPSEAVTPEAAP